LPKDNPPALILLRYAGYFFKANSTAAVRGRNTILGFFFIQALTCNCSPGSLLENFLYFKLKLLILIPDSITGKKLRTIFSCQCRKRKYFCFLWSAKKN
jgi:hypothetical protein